MRTPRTKSTPVTMIARVARMTLPLGVGAVVVALVASLTVTAGSAFALAPPLPTVNTEAASEIVFDAATLTGKVNPNGTEAPSDTKWCFEYGQGSTSGYNLGSVPAIAQDVGTGATPVPVSARLTGLSAGVTYRYRLVAVNDLGENAGQTACGTQGGQQTTGSEGVFTTPIYIPLPTVLTGTAANVTQNTATITGAVDPEGSRTTYEFQLGIDTSYGVEIFGSAGSGTQPEPFAVTLNNLQPATTYHYRLLATNAGGTTYGEDQTLTTSVYPTATLITPPTPPLLNIPPITFPTEPQTTTTRTTKTKKIKKKVKKTAAKTTRHGSVARTEMKHHANKRKGR